MSLPFKSSEFDSYGSAFSSTKSRYVSIISIKVLFLLFYHCLTLLAAFLVNLCETLFMLMVVVVVLAPTKCVFFFSLTHISSLGRYQIC